MHNTVQRIFDGLERAQAKVDAVAAKYERASKPLGEMFLLGLVDYDAYVSRSARIRMRMKRELDRIHI